MRSSTPLWLFSVVVAMLPVCFAFRFAFMHPAASNSIVKAGTLERPASSSSPMI
jgi:hypothetical protein